MHTFDVITWEDNLSDGSICYGAWCSYVLGVWGQGDTEEEALADITTAMTDVIHYPWEDGKSLADPDEATGDMETLMRELADENVSYRVHRVTISAPEPASV